MKDKKCSDCGISIFNTKNNKSGLCAKCRQKRYYKDNREKIISRQKGWTLNNKKRIKEYNSRPEVKIRWKERQKRPDVKAKRRIQKKEYRSRPEVKRMIKKYIKNNKEKAKKYRKRYYPDYYRKNKEKIKEYNSRPEVRKKLRFKGRKYRRSQEHIIKGIIKEFSDLNLIEYMKEYFSMEEIKKIKRIKIKEYNSRPEVKTYHKEYKQRPEVKKKSKEDYEKNKDYYKNYSKNYRSNPHAIVKRRAREKVRLNKDINFRIRVHTRQRLRQVLKKYTEEGKIMSSDKYGIDFKKIIKHLKPFPADITKYHIDHIKPLSSFNFVNEDGTQNLEEIKKAFAPKNHQWLLAEENLKKKDKIIEQSKLF